jgi:hypothetical protein
VLVLKVKKEARMLVTSCEQKNTHRYLQSDAKILIIINFIFHHLHL